jgi:hypothetical protein
VWVVGRGRISCSQVPDHTQGCHTREGGYPVRRGLSVQPLAPLGYWITRPSAQLRTRRVMTTGDDTASRSRGLICPRLAIEFPYPPVRGRRECRVHAAPAVSCAKVCKKAHTSIQGSGGIRHSLRNGFTAYIVLSSVGPGSLSPSPVRSFASHELDASIGASGPHDFAVRISTVRQRHIRVHRIPSRACDDRETPLVSGRDEIDILVIWPSGQPKFRKIRNWLTRPRTSREAEKFHERTFVLECGNAGQGLKLHREQVDALRPVDNAFGQLDVSSSRH